MSLKFSRVVATGSSIALLLAVSQFAIQAATGVGLSPAAADSNIYGTDSSGPGAAGSSPNYLEPGCTQYRFRTYMGQFGETTGTGLTEEAPGSTYNKQTIINQAYVSEQNGYGFGAGAYWWMGGIADTGYAQTASEATWWGGQQAANAIVFFQSAQASSGYKYTSNFIFMDIETGQGWSSNTALNQDTYNGFVTEMQTNGYNVGAYSGPGVWNQIMGSSFHIGQAEWTSEGDENTGSPTCPTGALTGGPYGYSTGLFFGGQSYSTTTALMWAFDSGANDYDNSDFTHWQTMFGI